MYGEFVPGRVFTSVVNKYSALLPASTPSAICLNYVGTQLNCVKPDSLVTNIHNLTSSLKSDFAEMLSVSSQN
jgi:hypothetical protein